MRRVAVLALAIPAAALAGCQHPGSYEPDLAAQRAEIAERLAFTYDSLAPDDWQPIQSGPTFHPDLWGIWRARGYGYVFDVGEDQLRWISTTSGHAWEHTPDGPLDVVFAIDRPSGRCYIKPYETESALILEPLEALPPSFSSSPASGPVATFERIDQTMAELYAFFDERDHDWSERAAAGRSQVTEATSPEELFTVLEGLFDGLGDGHTSLVAQLGDEARETTGSMSSIRRALEADYADQADTVTRAEYFGGWSDRLFTGIREKLLKGDARTAFDENLIWGRIRPEVGYLLIRDMASFGDEGDDLVDTLGQLHRELAKIFRSLADCEALILDVSFNRGGYHSFAMAFASHIADEERFALSKYPLGSPDLLQKFHVRPYCDRSGTVRTFTKPVYVVTTDACVSAGEEFVLAARPFPHVTIVGTPTQGMLSDMLEKPLPNGWMLNLSNEVFLDHEGQCFEVVGVPVDRPWPVFDLDNIGSVGHAESILALAEEIVP